MIDEIKKSINSILYERAKSPLFGTFLISWAIWNWRIFYISFFVSQNTIPNKLDFIHKYLYNKEHLIYYPLTSTILLLTVIPFINNGAYWLDVKFKNWRLEKKNELLKKQLLTVEQSIELRVQIKKQEERFHQITSEKDKEIEILKHEIDNLIKITETKTQDITTNIIAPEKIADETNILYNKLLNSDLIEEYLAVGKMINKQEYIRFDHKPTDTFLTLGLIKSVKVHDYNQSRIYSFTTLGEGVLKKAQLA